MKKSEKEAAEQVVGADTLVVDTQRKKEIEFYKSFPDLKAALEKDALLGKKEALVALARQLGVATQKESDDPTDQFYYSGEEGRPPYVDRTPMELYNDIFGEGDLLGSNFAGLDFQEGSDAAILAAAEQARVGKVKTTETQSIRALDEKDAAKFEAALKLYTDALKANLSTRSMNSLVKTAQKEIKSLNLKGFYKGDVTSIAGLDKTVLVDILSKLATSRFKSPDEEQKVKGDSLRLYGELVKLGDAGKAGREKLLKENAVGAGSAAALETASNTQEALGILREIRENTDETAPAGAKGGFLRGRSHQNGGIMAELEGGEFVFSKTAVRRLGRGNLDALNSGSASLRSPTAYGKKGGYAGSYGVGGTVISSLSDLTNIASNMDFSQFSQLIEKMNNFSAGNGMSQILGSNAVSGTGGILEEMMKRQMEAVQGGGQKQQSIRQQLDEVFQKRLGSLTGGLGTKKGQQLNNLLKKFSTIATALGGVENAEGRAGGKNALTAIEKTLKRFGQTSDQITNTMEIFKSLLGDEQTNLSQEEQLLKNMGLLKGKGAGGDDLLKQLKAMMGAQSDLLAPTKEIAKNTANCDCIDKLIAYLHGFPVEIGAEFGKQAGAGVAGGPGAGGPGAGGPGSKVPPPLKLSPIDDYEDPNFEWDEPIKPPFQGQTPPPGYMGDPIGPPGDFGGLGPGGGPRQTPPPGYMGPKPIGPPGDFGGLGDPAPPSPSLPPGDFGGLGPGGGPRQTPPPGYMSPLPPALEGALQDFGEFLGNPFEGLGGLLGLGGEAGTRASAPSGTSSFDEYIKEIPNRPFPSLNEGSFKAQPGLNQTAAMGSDFAAYKALGGIGGATQDSLIPKADRDAIIQETTSFFDRAKDYITESAKQFGEGIIEGGKNAAGVIQYSTKLQADAIANGAKMTDEEFRTLERSLLTSQQRIDQSVIEERNAAERGEKGTVGAGLITQAGLEEAVRNIRADDTLSKKEKILAEVKIRDTESQLGITGGYSAPQDAANLDKTNKRVDLLMKGGQSAANRQQYLDKYGDPEKLAKEKADVEKEVQSTALKNRTMTNKGTMTGSLERINRRVDLLTGPGGRSAANRAKFIEKYGTKEDPINRGGGGGRGGFKSTSSYNIGPQPLDKSNQEKLDKLNEERAKKGLKPKTLSQAIADKRSEDAKKTIADRRAREAANKKDTKSKKAATDPSAAKTLKDAMGIKDKGAKGTQKEIKKQTVQIKGGLCGCFERSIDKLIAFLAGYAVEISSEFTKIWGGGGPGGPGWSRWSRWSRFEIATQVNTSRSISSGV